jgi:small-conductance mechanosensitive channel
VLFAEFGDWGMKFNLICFVEDIEQGERTRSDINFEVVRRLREAGLRIAYPAPPPADVPSRFEPEPKPKPEPR